MSFHKPDWFPSWFPDHRENSQPQGSTAANQHVSVPLETLKVSQERSNDALAPQPASSLSPSSGQHSEDIERLRPDEPVKEEPDLSRSVRRRLGAVHLFMITINGTLGVGLYWRGGDIVEVGGPLAAVLSFFLIGMLAWAVMQCITELLCIWPVPSAMAVYVSEFVDEELGIAVGVAYWFTYSVSFAALMATTAAEVEYWNTSRGIQAGVIFILLPCIMILINSFGIEVYGFVEVVVGSMKIAFLVVIIISLIAINIGVGDGPAIGSKYWNDPTPHEPQAASSWGVAFLMALSMAAFAFVGVEIIAASALEARWPMPQVGVNGGTNDGVTDRANTNDTQFSRRSGATLIGETVKFSAIWISIFATIAYTLGGLLVAFDIGHDDCSLSRLSWVNGTSSCNDYGRKNEPSSSLAPFVAIAKISGIPRLADTFNVFLVFTATTCANTNLYVASRTLFGLTSRLKGGRGEKRYIRILAWFGKTNHRKVPMRAMVLSAFAFWWVPFLYLAPRGSQATSPIGQFIEILSQMGTVGVMIVWACECWAFIRYYNCISEHKEILQRKKLPQVRRWDLIDNDYPYRSHGQPLTAYLALAACLFILFVANGSFLFRGFHYVPFMSAYLTMVVFFLIVVGLKFRSGAKWKLVDLSQPQTVMDKFNELNEIRYRGIEDTELVKNLWNLWGYI